MINFKDVLDEALGNKKLNNLNVFYNIKAFIQAWGDTLDNVEQKEVEKTPQSKKEEKDQDQDQEQEQNQEQELNQSYEEKGSILNEDIFKSDKKGIITVSEEEVDEISTVEDLLNFLERQEKTIKITDKIVSKPTKIIDKVIIEIALALVNNDQEALKQIIGKGDKIYVDIDYGKEKESSVGLRILKNEGSLSISLNMKKDGRIIAMPFDKVMFNKCLIDIRNETLG